MKQIDQNTKSGIYYANGNRNENKIYTFSNILATVSIDTFIYNNYRTIFKFKSKGKYFERYSIWI